MLLHRNFIFAHLTKTGGTFIRQYLSEYVGGFASECKGKRMEKHGPLDILPEIILESRYKFGAIRNPLSFYISLWGANTTPKAINNRPKRKIWFKNKPEMKEDPREFIRFLCDGEKGQINFFDFDLMREMDIGVMTYRYLHLYYNHKIFNDKKWYKNHNKYRLVDEVIRIEDDLKKELVRVFKESIFPLDPRRRKGLDKYPRKNKSNHKPYMEYYDKKTIRYVKHKERFIFKLHYGGNK